MFRFIFTYKKLVSCILFFFLSFLVIVVSRDTVFSWYNKELHFVSPQNKTQPVQGLQLLCCVAKESPSATQRKKSAHIWQQKEKCGVPSQWRQRPSRPCQCFVGHFTDCWCSVTPRVRSSLCGTPCFSVCVVSFPCYCTTCQHGTKTSVNDSQ